MYQTEIEYPFINQRIEVGIKGEIIITKMDKQLTNLRKDRLIALTHVKKTSDLQGNQLGHYIDKQEN